jgi:hypothetical protein
MLPDAERPEAVWRGDKLHLVFRDGREYPTSVARLGTAKEGRARLVRVGKRQLAGDIAWTFFPCDVATATGAAGSFVLGVAVTRYAVVAFELACESAGVFSVAGSGEDDGDEYEDDNDTWGVVVLSEDIKSGRGVRCQIREEGGLAVVAIVSPSDRECAVYAWALSDAAPGQRWRWSASGCAQFVLPVDFSGSLIDAVSIEGESVVLRQPGRRNLRFGMRSTDRAAAACGGVRWSYGDGAWALACPGDESLAPSLAGRIDKNANLFCVPTELPGLAAAWRGAALAAVRSACGAADMCPVYVEVTRGSASKGLPSLLGAVDADRVMLILSVLEAPDQAWLSGGNSMTDELRDFVRAVRDTFVEAPGAGFRFALLASPRVTASVHGIVESYSVQVLGPYTELQDEAVVAHLAAGMPEIAAPDPAGAGIVWRDDLAQGARGRPARGLVEPYRLIKSHCLKKWEESFDGEPEGGCTPFLLPVAQVQRLLQDAAAHAGEAGDGMMRRVAAELSKIGAGAMEMPEEMRRRLVELPLLLRESGGEVLYGQDEAIWATQRHLQAHLLRASGNKPTFVFYVGVNGLGKTSLAHSAIRALGGALEEVNCSSLDNAYAYGEKAGFTVLNRKIAALRLSPSPLKALLLDEVDKNIDMLKALIRLADSDAAAPHGLLDHPLAGIFVFITLNVVPDCDEHRKFVEEDEPQARMERLRDLIVASVKNVGDAKVVHAIVSRLIPYIVVFNELNAEGDRGRRHMLSLAEDEVRGFSAEYGLRVVLDDDALEGLVRRSSPYGVGGFRSVRTFMRREIESAIGDMRAQAPRRAAGEVVVLRDAGTHLSGASTEEGETVLYAVAVTRHKRIAASLRAAAARALDATKTRDDDKMRLDQQGAYAAALEHFVAEPLFAVDGAEAKFTENDKGDLMTRRVGDEDEERPLKASLAELRGKFAHHSRELLEGSNQQAIDAAARDLLSQAGRVFRLSLPGDLSACGPLRDAAPRWSLSAWDAYVKHELTASSKAEAVRQAFRELSGEWAKLVDEQEKLMSDVRKFPELRARAAKRGAEIAADVAERSARFGLEEATISAIGEMVIDGESEERVLKRLEADARSYEPPPMSVHLLAGVAMAFLLDWLVRDMLHGDYAVADRKRAAERFRQA